MHPHRSSIRLAGRALTLIGVVYALPLAAQPRTSRPPASSAPEKSDYRAILTEASGVRARIAAMGRVDPARITALLAPVRSRLHAWATRYRVTLATRKVPAVRLQPGSRPNAATVIKIIDLNGGTVDCDPDGPDGHPCTLVAVDKEGSKLYCVYECPDTQPSEM